MTHTYKPIYTNRSQIEMAKMICKIQNSSQYEINDLNHIIVKNSSKKIGYFGDDTFEIVDSDNKKLKKHHKNISMLCYVALHNLDN